MKPKWLISSNCYDDGNPEKMRSAAEKMGCDVQWFKYIPFEHDRANKKLFQFEQNDCVITYGSIQLCKLVERIGTWTPSSWTPWKKLYCSSYLSYWGQYSVHQDYMFISLAEFKRNHKKLFNRYGLPNKVESSDRDIFIKPDNNEKTFHGEKISLSQYDKWLKYVDCYEPAPETMCLISTPVDIAREWRMVVGDKKVVTGSQYRKLVNGESSVEIEPGYPHEVEQFVEDMVNSGTFEPTSVYCVDVCELLSGELRMVEIGGVNCAGLYDCDMEKIVETANRIAIREWEEINNI